MRAAALGAPPTGHPPPGDDKGVFHAVHPGGFSIKKTPQQTVRVLKIKNKLIKGRLQFYRNKSFGQNKHDDVTFLLQLP
jgi:hypothetical protein